MVNVPINYVAVVVAAVVNMALGYVWYGPLFGKKWMSLMGITKEQMDVMKSPEAKNKMMMGYGLTFIGSLVMAYVLAHIFIFAKVYLEVSGMSAGFQAGLWSWLGFIAPVTLGSVLWERKPWMLWVLNNAYWLIGLVLMGLVLSYWM